MKRITLISITLIFFASFLLIFENCGDNGTEPEPNKPPTISISSPANNAAVALGTSVQISITASDPDGSIGNVQISIDNVSEATLQSPPYSYSWNTADATPGQHTIKAVATDNQGLNANAQVTITITVTANTPTVTTADISEITDNSATGGGEVTDDGGQDVTARGVVWGESSEPTLDNKSGFTEDGDGSGAFTSSLTDLSANTTYYVRAYATNSEGTAYGEATSFTTLAGPLTVTTADITDIEAHVAAGGGEVTDLGGGNSDPIVGLVWSTSSNPEWLNNEGFYYGTGLLFEVPITGLDPSTTYYVRAFATYDGSTFAYGEEISFTTSAFSIQTGSFTDTRDDTQYNTVTISGQTWMAENLAYLPEVCASDAECGYWVYDYQGTEVAAAMATANYTTYGVLYNWEMAKTACPTGWHLPSEEEWAFLEVHLGMNINLTVGEDMRGTDEGGKLKETGITHWNDPNYGATNISGFTALGAGGRDSGNDTFYGMGIIGNFWTSTDAGNFIRSRYLYNDTEQVGAQWFQIGYGASGYSVRCVQD